jgi:antitoxin YefM
MPENRYTVSLMKSKNHMCRFGLPGKKTAAVLVSEEDWRAIEETLFLVSIPGMRDAIKAAMAEPLADSVKEIEW